MSTDGVSPRVNTEPAPWRFSEHRPENIWSGKPHPHTDRKYHRDSAYFQRKESDSFTSPQHLQPHNHLIKMNVGGVLFTTSSSTLQAEPDSLLAKIFDPETIKQHGPSMTDEAGIPFLDRDPGMFRFVLGYLRRGTRLVGFPRDMYDVVQWFPFLIHYLMQAVVRGAEGGGRLLRAFGFGPRSICIRA